MVLYIFTRGGGENEPTYDNGVTLVSKTYCCRKIVDNCILQMKNKLCKQISMVVDHFSTVCQNLDYLITKLIMEQINAFEEPKRPAGAIVTPGTDETAQQVATPEIATIQQSVQKPPIPWRRVADMDGPRPRPV